MSKITWSKETLEARAEAAAAIEKFLRLTQKDQIATPGFMDMTDEEKESYNAETKMLSSWVVVAEFVKMEDMEESSIVYGASGCTPATQQGLVAYAVEDL